ncbi:hypothetical protein CcI49_26770 [Frankia sp. CcI49]|nr:hypothetical protein CcI49_26770 [Frankia sp. CcI49]
MSGGHGEWVNGHDLVFVQPNGRPIDSRADHRAWQDLLTSRSARRSAPRCSAHDGEPDAREKVHPRVVMEITGTRRSA